MEELKLLIEMVANLPNTALWVIAAIFAYKVCIVGSIYGVIRFAIEKTHNWLVTPKHKLVRVEMEGQIRGITIAAHADDFIAQLYRLRGKGTAIQSEYVHKSSVDWLRQAIDEKEAREVEAAATKPAGSARS